MRQTNRNHKYSRKKKAQTSSAGSATLGDTSWARLRQDKGTTTFFGGGARTEKIRT